MTDFSAITATVEEMEAEFQKVATSFREKMQGMFSDMTKSFFEAAPEIKAVVWEQYTPYFNDGEECIFSVNDLYFLTEFPEDGIDCRVWELEDDDIEGINVFQIDADKDNLKYYQDAIKKYGSSAYYTKRIAAIKAALENPRHAELSKVCKTFSNLIQRNDDLMQSIFGDHVTVTLTPNGSSTEECSHD